MEAESSGPAGQTRFLACRGWLDVLLRPVMYSHCSVSMRMLGMPGATEDSVSCKGACAGENGVLLEGLWAGLVASSVGPEGPCVRFPLMADPFLLLSWALV